MSNFYIDNNVDKTESINCDFYKLIINHLYEFIDNNKNWVIGFIISIY